jgi:hypothetical protein
VRLQKHLTLGVLVLALVPLQGCAMHAGQKHQAVVAATVIHDSLAALQDGEQVLFDAGKVTPVQHRAFNAKLVPALKAGLAFDRAIEAWPNGAPAPPELPVLVNAIGELTAAIADAFPDSDAKAAILVRITTIQQALLSLFNLMGVVR